MIKVRLQQQAAGRCNFKPKYLYVQYICSLKAKNRFSVCDSNETLYLLPQEHNQYLVTASWPEWYSKCSLGMFNNTAPCCWYCATLTFTSLLLSGKELNEFYWCSNFLEWQTQHNGRKTKHWDKTIEQQSKLKQWVLRYFNNSIQFNSVLFI